jgi:phosphatidate phosphatase APP1
VYADLVARYPGRIRAIYIRHVHQGDTRDSDIQALADRVAQSGCQMILAKDSLEMAQHAFENGLIARRGLEEVRADCRRRGS